MRASLVLRDHSRWAELTCSTGSNLKADSLTSLFIHFFRTGAERRGFAFSSAKCTNKQPLPFRSLPQWWGCPGNKQRLGKSAYVWVCVWPWKKPQGHVTTYLHQSCSQSLRSLLRGLPTCEAWFQCQAYRWFIRGSHDVNQLWDQKWPLDILVETRGTTVCFPARGGIGAVWLIGLITHHHQLTFATSR